MANRIDVLRHAAGIKQRQRAYRDQKANQSMVELWACTGGANQQWTLP